MSDEQSTENTTEQQQPTQSSNGNRREARELEGALFKNDKGDNPKRPDYRGRCKINGQNYKLSAWVRTDRKDKKYMSLAFTVDDGTSN